MSEPAPSIAISDATREDLADVLAIYNEVIRNSTAVYSETELTAESGAAWFEGKTRLGHPFLVARDASGIVGFGSFGEFRAWPCYRLTVEHSVHVRADRRGRGVGTALVRALLAEGMARGKHVMIAGIDADNEPSLKMHQKLGFTVVGRFHEVGFKFGRWLDLVFLQRLL
jgi:phosphinothricin acetyltransferase